jgi:hypothetical protein
MLLSHPPLIVRDMTCHETLVLHSDGTAECAGSEHCGCDELVHPLWISCHELACGCIGEEHDLTVAWLEAA